MVKEEFQVEGFETGLHFILWTLYVEISWTEEPGRLQSMGSQKLNTT